MLQQCEHVIWFDAEVGSGRDYSLADGTRPNGMRRERNQLYIPAFVLDKSYSPILI